MVKKRGQMKIQQMAFMLIAVTLFFVLVGLFMLSTKFSDLKKSAETLDQKNSLLLTSKIASYPELACGTAFGTQSSNCIDTDKLMILLEKGGYDSFYSVSSLQIQMLSSDSDEVCTKDNYPNCSLFDLIPGSSPGGASIFVSLCRKESISTNLYNKCELGRIFVGF